MPPSDKTLLAGLFAAAVILTAIVVSRPVETLVGVVPDDAFYYLAIGRHAAASGHPSFDGENPSSGFHPAWMLAVTAAAYCFPGRVELLRAALAMSFAFHIASGFLLYRIFKRFLLGRVAALAAGVWLFSYLPLLAAVFALETSLYCFAFLWSYLVYLAHIEPYLHGPQHDKTTQIPTRSLISFGVVLGFCILARTEGVVLLACAAGWLGASSLAERRAWRNYIEGVRRGFFVCIAALAIISPWLIYSLHEFGTIRQASGAMKMLWMQDQSSRLGLGELLKNYAVRYAEWLAFSTPWTWNGGFNAAAAALTPLWLAVFFGVIIFIKRCSTEQRRSIADVLPAVVYPLLHIIVAGAIYCTLFADVQCWYLALPYLESFAAIVIFGGAIYTTASCEKQDSRVAVRVLAVAAVLTLLGLVRFSQTLQAGYWPWQRDVYAQIEPVEKILPPHAKIGCFNAGIPGYFGHRTVVNLDGLVNDAVVPYWREKRFDDYLRAAGIDAIVDEQLSLSRAKRFSRDFPPLREKARFHLTNFTSDTRFVWLLRDAP
jgi:hypothetical protein